MVTNKLNSNMGTTSTNSESSYQMLRTWGMIFTYGLTLVCLVAFICTCVDSQKIYNEHYDVIRVDKVFNPVSLVYLFSCIPSLAFGCLFSVVARIGENVQAMKDAQGGNEAVGAGSASQKKEGDISNTLLIVAAVVIVVVVTLVATLGLLK